MRYMKTTSAPMWIAALVLTFVAGGAVSLLAKEALSPNPPAATYPTNSIGLTYGEVDQLPLPDLVAVTTDDGQEGYAFSLQINGRPPEAGAQRGADLRRGVPVYDLDLTVQLGVLTL